MGNDVEGSVLSWHLLGVNQENQGEPYTGWSMSWPRFK